LTDQQWRILRALSESDDELEPRQIAEACKIQKPSLTGIVARMVELKWIDHHWSTVDQRRQMISLTPKGRALVDRMTPLIDRQYRLIEDAVGVDRLNAIYRTLDATLGLLSGDIASVFASARSPKTDAASPKASYHAARRLRTPRR
jgi:homoprotocatechuate degradation regulator HpaR